MQTVSVSHQSKTEKKKKNVSLQQYYNQQSQHGTTSATTSYSQRSESSARDESHEHRSPTRKHQQGTRALSRRMSKDQYMSGKMSQQHNEVVKNLLTKILFSFKTCI